MTLKAGIIGLGVGAHHINAFDAHPNCQVSALCDFSEERWKWANDNYPGVKITRDAVDILDDPDLDVISIASYDNYHFNHILRGIRNGKHIFVEKPLCLYPEEALTIKDSLASVPEIRLSSNLNLRTSPRFIRLYDEIQSGRMGDIYYLEGDYMWGRVNKLVDGWRGEMDFYSIVYGAAIHMIDLFMWITRMRPVKVQGLGNRISTKKAGFKFYDFATILMEFDNGMTAKVTANGGCVHPHFHKVSAFGTKKSFVHDLSGGRFLISRDLKADSEEVVDEYPGVIEKSMIITTFIDSIFDPGAEALVSSKAVFDSMAVCFAAERAIHEGKILEVDYI